MIKSPYNFVPAPNDNEVFYPDWADQVSHDIPFEDGESGEIELTITAASPIFIRNGHSKEDGEIFEKYRSGDLARATDKEKEAYIRFISFSNIDGRYFIPATSIKGMLRNVLEIISNSKLSQINDHHHAVRQIMRTKGDVIDEGYSLSNDEVKKTIKCGYLIKIGNDYFIYSCGFPLKIRYTDLDNKLRTKFNEQFGEGDEANLKENFDHRTAAYKYSLLNGKNLEKKFEMHPLNENNKQKSWKSVFQPLSYARFASEESNDDETFDGNIVLVGQASNYNISTSRRGEYVFEGKKSDVLANIQNRVQVTEEQLENFKFINRDGKGPSNELKDWGYWKPKISEGIPVFYREKTVNGKRSVIDFGLSFMYKEPAKYSVKDLLPKYTKEKDLSELIFGSATKDNSLKGRVFISNAFCVDPNPSIVDEITVTLGSPKSSFTPFYIIQKGENGKTSGYNTYNTGGTLRGYKRYPVKSNIVPYTGDAINMQSRFKPLSKGTKFNAKIRFHNLRPLEIGAIFNAITFNGHGNCLHSLGYAKPLGYGHIKVEILSLRGLINEGDYYSKLFKVEMKARYGQSWNLRVNELLAMSQVNNEIDQDKLKYNVLTEFQQIKNDGYFLQPFSEITGILRVELDENYQLDVENRINELLAEENEKKELQLENELRLQSELALQEEKRLKEEERLASEQEKIRAEKRGAKQMEAKNQGLILNELNTSSRNAYSELNKIIQSYAGSLHSLNDNQLKKIKDGYLLQESDLEPISNSVIKIFTNIQSKKDREKWVKAPLEKNPYFIKIRWWLGEIRAQALFNKLSEIHLSNSN